MRMSWFFCQVNRISCALTTMCIYTIYFVMASTYFEKMHEIGRILRYSSVVSFCKDLMLSENKESSSMRTDEDSSLHYRPAYLMSTSRHQCAALPLRAPFFTLTQLGKVPPAFYFTTISSKYIHTFPPAFACHVGTVPMFFALTWMYRVCPFARIFEAA